MLPFFLHKKLLKGDITSLSIDSSMSKQDVGDLAIKYQEENHYLKDRIRLLHNELFWRKSKKKAIRQ
jgi:hypothetical protein